MPFNQKAAREQAKDTGAAEKQQPGRSSAGSSPKRGNNTQNRSSKYRNIPEQTLWQKICLLPGMRAIGNMLYALGFYAEAKLLLFWRLLRDAGIFLLQIFSWLFGGIFRGIANALKAAVKELTLPFRRFANGVRQVRRMRKEARGSERDKLNRQITAYVSTGLKKNRYLVPRLFAFIMPVLALGGFVFTIHMVLNMHYALSVSVEDNLIGYVDNETVLEDGLNLLRMKISLAEGQEMDDWVFTPTLSVAPATTTLNKTQVADKILQSSSDSLKEGYGLYIDGVLRGATANGEELTRFLESKKEVYKNTPGWEDAQIDFVRDVEVSAQPELFFPSSVKTMPELEEGLDANVSEGEMYTVQQGDTLGEIAHSQGVTMEELLARNPDLEGQNENFIPAEGTQLTIHRADPLLQVQVVLRSNAVETVPFTTIRNEVNTRRKGQTATIQQGKDGQERVWYDSIYVDGELVSKVRVDELTEEIVPVQDKIIEVGTAELGALPNVDGAGYIWPVPDATYSYRGFSSYHRGLDINAPTGTPIYAAAGGQVITAGWHWSYGNYVVIQHSDGTLTLYGHCSELLVTAGQSVAQGDPIALVGSTGVSTGPHLHFEIQVAEQPINPAPYVVAPWD